LLEVAEVELITQLEQVMAEQAEGAAEEIHSHHLRRELPVQEEVLRSLQVKPELEVMVNRPVVEVTVEHQLVAVVAEVQEATIKVVLEVLV
jgi:hypothetical protein